MVDSLSIPPRSYQGGDPPADVNAMVAKVNELAAIKSIATLSIPTRTAGAGTRDLFRTDMNALRARIDEIATSFAVASTGLTDWASGYDVTTEHSRVNTLVAKVNQIVAAANASFYAAVPAGAIWVSTTGNDTTGDGTQGAPYATMTKAMAMASAGSTVALADGAYGTFTWTKSGTSGSRITLMSATRWGAQFSSGSSARPLVVNADHVTVRGFDIGPAVSAGTGLIFGLSGSATGGRAEQNYVHDIGTALPSGSAGAGINLADYAATSGVVDRNVVARCGAAGNINLQGIYFSAANQVITNNIVIDCKGWGIHGWHAVTDATVANNVVGNSGTGNIIVGSGDSGGRTINNCKVVNNIMLNSPKGLQMYAASPGTWGTGHEVRNNQIYNCTAPTTYNSGTPGVVTGTLTTDPLFVSYSTNPMVGSYKLQSASPCRNSGTTTGAPPIDYEGVSRPQGTAVDRGAYEAA